MSLELTPEQKIQKWIALAANENTSPDLLLKLEKLGSLKVKQALPAFLTK